MTQVTERVPGKPHFTQSNAQWPLDVYRGMYGDGISTDTHATEEGAAGVCAAMLRDGFGGEGKHFPLAVWVSEVGAPRCPPNKEYP